MNAAVIPLVLAAAFATPAWAVPIATRGALDGMLGVGAMSEAFENYTIANGTLGSIGASLSSTSTPNGQGPGLIARGLDITTTSGALVWQGNALFNLPTKTLGTDPSTDVTINFTTFVTAAGLDVMNYGGFPSINNVTFFGLDDTTVIGTFPGLSFPSAVTPMFVGFESAAGIGSIRVETVSGFGPVIDNLEFGTPGWIGQRSALDAMLGANASNENFENLSLASNTVTFFGGPLDNATTVNGQGPGLVVPGVTLSASIGGLAWQGNGFFGISTKTMGSNPASDLTVDFDGGVDAFGVDVRNYGGFPNISDLTVFGPDDTTVIGVFLGLDLPAAASSQFMGFTSPGGIGSFRIDMFQGFGPVVDNLAFGNQAPEPATLALLSLGLAGLGWSRRKR